VSITIHVAVLLLAIYIEFVLLRFWVFNAYTMIFNFPEE
jgi:hypothetical protein